MGEWFEAFLCHGMSTAGFQQIVHGGIISTLLDESWYGLAPCKQSVSLFAPN